jgi:ubiquinone/menaquinone biosynthesis C-methylase UbiE
VAIFIDHIPYLNLVGTTVSTVIITVTVICICILFRKLSIFIAMIGVLIVLWIFSVFLRLTSYQEAVGSTIYVLSIGIAIWFLLSERLSQRGGTSHVESQRKLFNEEFSKIDSSDLAQWQQSYIRRIKEYLLVDGKKNAKIVELGCGDGKLSIATAKLGHMLTACDISDTSIKLTNTFAKREGVQIRTVQCDVTQLPFKDASFDYAIAGAILEHLEDEDTALTEWSRVLKKGGRIMIVTPLRQRHVLPVWWILNWFHDRRLGHVRRYDKRRYEGLSRYGLHLTDVVYTGHTPKVIVAILHIITKLGFLERLAERVDVAFEKVEYDGNNIIGFFIKK